MTGYLYINSFSIHQDQLTEKLNTVFNIYIQYDDGQFIKTDITVPIQMASHEDLFETVKKYFKGELRLMSHI